MRNCSLKSQLLVSFVAFILFFPATTQSQSDSKWDKVAASVKKRNSFKRLEWFYRPRMNEQGIFPREFIDKQKQVEFSKIQAQKIYEKTSYQWTNLGPVGIDFTFESTAPHWGINSGRVKGLAIHPSNPDIVYAGSGGGGIWKTTDGGQNWIDKSDGMNLLTFGAIAIDPSNPEVIYAGTGEYFWSFPERLYCGDGLYKSTNGGNSWVKMNAEFGNVTHFTDLVVSPYNPNVIVATIAKNLQNASPNEGIWKSTDAGIHWAIVLPGEGMYDLAFHPANPDILYAACGNEQTQAGFLISTDGGQTFIQSNTGLPASNHIGRIHFDVSQSNPSVIYTVIYDSVAISGGMNTCAYKSTNGGASWAQISQGINLSAFGDQGFYDLCIAVNPANSNNVILGNVEISRSADGSTFSYIRDPNAAGGGSYAFDSYTHLDHQIIRFAPSNPSVIYVGCDGGVYKSTDTALSFHSVNTGITSIQTYRVASHITNPDVLYTGAQDNGFISTHNRGATPYKLELMGDGTECFMDYSNPDIIFFGTIGGYFGRSIDGGLSWGLLVDPVALNDSSAFICPYWQHPTDPNIIYGCLKLKLYKSTDKGNTWSYTTAAPIVSSAIYSAAQSAINTNNIMLAARNGAISLVKSSDGGYNWQNITANLGSLSGGNFMRLQADPLDGNTFYLLKNAYSGALVLKTTDFGTSWTDLSSDLPKVPVNDIFIDSANAGVLYIGNDFGVYRTANGGGNWVRLNNGMPFIPVLDFDCFNYNGIRLLRAATFGRGVFELDLNHPESVNGNLGKTTGFRAWPNPASSQLWVDIPAIVPDKYTLSLISVSGVKVASQTVYTTGLQFRSSIDISGLNPGCYQLVFNGNRKLQTCEVIIVR